MRALDRMLVRDFRRLAAQALAIALVLACGVATLLISFGMHRALDETRTAYYERNEFADIFVQARRVPLSLLPEIAAIEGVRIAEPRIRASAVLDLPGRDKTAAGHLLSLPVTGLPQLNRPVLLSGRLPDPAMAGEVAVNAAFAKANGFLPGDRFEANLNGRKQALTITGLMASPEFVYTIGPGALMPDNAGFGIVWMPEATLAATHDMQGAFNDLALVLTRDAVPGRVIDALDRLLEPYGGMGAHDRSLQQSNAFVEAEILQLRTMSFIMPPIFFAISIFLVNMVINRIVALDRAEIGLLKALGYTNLEVAFHYIALAMLVALVGIGLGWAAGWYLSRALARLYAQFFDFPFLIFSTALDAYAVSGVLGLLTAGAGALASALRAAALPPAVAMQPPAPPHYRRGLIDRLLEVLRPSQPTMMILRSIIRWPLRSALTALGLSLAVAMLVASSFFQDALDEIVDLAFFQSWRQDAMVMFNRDMPETALSEIARLPGVMQVEGAQMHAVVLRHGYLEKQVGLEGRAPGTDLARVVDAEGRPVPMPPEGILLTERLADRLEARPGDLIEVEFMTGLRETHVLPVAGLVRQYFGLGAYMDMAALDRLFRRAPQITVANLMLDDARADAFHAAVKKTPAVAGTVMLTESRISFQDTIRQNVVIMTTVYVVIAVLITFGVSYNSARIQLSERARELASLRILGFTRAEVSYILMGETMLLALLAQPLGWFLGGWIAFASSRGFQSDLYTVPLVLNRSNFGIASLVVLGAAMAAALLVRRRLDRLDLVAVMKTRE
ncbi:FtsX-like permease family protein [Halovulum dunhuangense]|uniref:FtsX-like permease family protein n=1 Tax=Halovulum dunhuangense TaxID=1505036 RepID=A0A849L6H9_9RHOB|nr:FtsX-like permease family protein [Halovulum dunhuangense]NNU81687.1 FtsX-like permease family protein [Halovulum dunhuangense]